MLLLSPHDCETGLHVFCAIIFHASSGKDSRTQGGAKQMGVLSPGCGFASAQILYMSQKNKASISTLQ
jgi:hypothetical protein